jgi:hypothetical protein
MVSDPGGAVGVRHAGCNQATCLKCARSVGLPHPGALMVRIGSVSREHLAGKADRLMACLPGDWLSAKAAVSRDEPLRSGRPARQCAARYG